jgi:hypothetical protein
MKFEMASRIAASEPGHGAIQVSAMDAVFDSRVSITINFAPAIFPSIIRCAGGLN